jgi:glycosyltransferase involved in cell wall biosynthesis
VGSASGPPLIAQGLYSFRIGGSERVGAQLSIEYARRGYRVVCFAFHGSTGPFRDYLESHGIECVDLNYLTRTRATRRLTYQFELYRFFRHRNVRAIHVQHAMALTLCGISARYAGIKRVVMTEHDIFQLDEQPKYQRNAARCCRYASAITGVHSGITDYFRDHMGVPADRLHVIPNGVPEFTADAERCRRTRAALGVADSTFVCLYVGRLEAVKGLRILLNAVARLKESVGRPTRVFLAGDGSERAALESLCQSLNLTETVTFLGERSDVRELLNMADVFVMTSRTEGLPMALIEAMAASLPCVATAVGGIPAVLSDDAGILVPPDDPDAVAQALTRVAGDDLLRRQLAEHALHAVRTRYGLEPVVNAYLKLLGLPPRWPPEQ